MTPYDFEIAARLGSVEEYYFSRKLREIEEMRRAGADILSLGIGSPDLPPHPSVVERLALESAKISTHGYQSYRGAVELRNALAMWYSTRFGVELNPESEILPLIGSKEGIMHTVMTYISKGDKVLVPNTGYPTYSSAVRLAEGEVVNYLLKEENGYMPELDTLPTKGVKMMIVNYPHMPTGAVASRGDLQQIVDWCRKHHILLVNDNPYCFIRNDNPLSILAMDGAREVAIELNSLSKSHNMAGWRIGMIGGAKERIDEILRFKSNMDSGMFLPLQLAAATALGLGDEWYASQNEIYRRREAKGLEILEALGVECRPNQAGLFLWGRVPEGDNCYDFCDRLLYEKHIFLTPGGIFGSEGEQYVRLSLCASEEMLERVLERIKS
ncbi:MAG: aminotransferase class I/II-fold pyridoxal phosphate-dependent enzyme [Rikenellaceae bacterium]|nr:aminotransferase class I/II-fold pyridoxal phosphate-dependent enzyme [Rikenellaceae bacterium]